MTREEREKAIDLLDNLKGMIDDTQGNDYDFAIKKAIEALKQEPCEDAVSLASVFEILGNLMAIPYDLDRPINKDDVGESMDKIKALPSVKPVQNWTPTSERLPKTNEYVDNVCKYYLVQNEFGDMLVATYTNNGWIPINTTQALEYDVVAWCPLPKSYQEEKENEE